jgi:PAS domain S-box-containing protein
VFAKRRSQVALFVLFVLLASVLAVGVYAAHNLYRSAEDRYIGLVFPLRNATRDVVLHMVDEETAVRGYMITHDRSSLDTYFTGSRGVVKDIATITSLTRDRPELAGRLVVLQQEIQSLQGFYDRLITFVADGRLGQARARTEVLDGTKLFNSFRRTSTLMQEDIVRLSEQTRAQQHRTYVQAVTALGTAGFLALMIAATLLVKVPEQLRRLLAAEEAARLAAEHGANAARALAHVSDAVVLIDDAGIVRGWNEAAEPLLGPGRASAVGRPAREIVPEYDRLVDGGRRREPFVPVSVGGDELWLSPAVSTFEGGSVLTIRDVTSRYLLERARADFVTTASHELRTPLTAIYGGVRTLLGRRDAFSEEQRDRLLRMIEQESAHLAQIVDQLLITAQLDRGSLRVTEAPCDVRALCESVVEAAQARSEPDVTIALEVPDDTPSLLCDESLLRQVLVNLVENAIKYSPDGGRIDVRLRFDRRNVRIAVSDRGLGIPPSEQERIFEKFYRLDAEMTRGVGGSGLGLFISREIVSQMDGTLTVRSEPGSGSTFTVALPRQA